MCVSRLKGIGPIVLALNVGLAGVAAATGSASRILIFDRDSTAEYESIGDALEARPDLPAFAEWKERAEQGRACDYHQPFFTNTDYIDICVGAPVVSWEGPWRGRALRTAYCAECARSGSPTLTYTSPARRPRTITT